jgi:aminopeptidase-like protein
VLSNLADAGKIHYKKSRRGNTDIDKIVAYVLQESQDAFEILNFSPYGYDERQFCSPGFNLPIGRFTRSPNGAYPEYHTSADDLNFIKRESITDSFQKLFRVIQLIENNKKYMNQNPHCEPQLGRRGIYHAMGGMQGIQELQHALLWVLNLSDGSKSLLDICLESNLSFDLIYKAAALLSEKNLTKAAAEEAKTTHVDVEELFV